MTGEEMVSWERCKKKKKVKDGALSSFFSSLTWQDETQPAVRLVVRQVGTQIYQISINHSS